MLPIRVNATNYLSIQLLLRQVSRHLMVQYVTFGCAVEAAEVSQLTIKGKRIGQVSQAINIFLVDKNNPNPLKKFPVFPCVGW